MDTVEHWTDSANHSALHNEMCIHVMYVDWIHDTELMTTRNSGLISHPCPDMSEFIDLSDLCARRRGRMAPTGPERRHEVPKSGIDGLFA